MITQQRTICRLNSNGNSTTIHDVLAVLSSTKRMEIITAIILFRSMSVSELTAALQYEVSDISRNVRALRNYGLVKSSRFKRKQLQELSPAVKASIRGGTVRLSIHIDKASNLSLSYKPKEFLIRRLSEYSPINMRS